MTTTRANTRHISGILQLSTEADITEGKDWYDRAYRFAVKLMHRYDGLKLGQAVGVIAALSPNNKWHRNCNDAEALIKTWAEGGDYSLIKVCTYGANKAKAVAILSLNAESLDSEAIASILNGQKITSFYRSIMGDQANVCVDGHAYAVWIGERISTNKTPSISKTLYETIQRSYRLVADRSVDLCGHVLTPVQVQAVTWVTYRRIHGVR